MKQHYLLCLVLSATSAAAQQRTAPLWQPSNATTALPSTVRKAAQLSLDEPQLAGLLRAAPTEQQASAGVLVPVPLPEGGTEVFRLWQVPVLHPALAARYPEIQTYAGQSVSNPGITGRFDLTPQGFHGYLMGKAGGAVFINPVAGTRGQYRCFGAADRRPDPQYPFRELPPISLAAGPAATAGRVAAAPFGNQLRTYRLAVGCTVEYSAAVGATTKAQALAAIVTSVNRVVGIYEKELAIRMQLVANNDLVVYVTGNDNYTNNNSSALLSQNQTKLDAIIGSANYDIGHVFSTAGGGRAALGVVCRTGLKAQGETGTSNPTGDAYDVDYVAHEMGHQFGANHSFNSEVNFCEDNRNQATSMEPGSGSTIMAYAGICASDDLQNHSDPYFHAISQDEIRTYVTTGLGSGCGTPTNTGNTAPVVSAGADFSIPKGTPFALTGSATDANGDVLTYDWEQMNAGGSAGSSPVAGVADVSTVVPIFRSFSPSASPTRTFPRLISILGNTSTIGEILPLVNRSLTFRLTVRDNRPGGGGVSSDNVTVTVVATNAASAAVGPFLITSDNVPATMRPRSTRTVTWSVNNTNTAPLNTTAVDILFSADGGQTFPYVLLANTPNDGSQEVLLPTVNTATGRLRVQARNSVYFDINNANLTLSGAPLPVELTAFEARVRTTDVLLQWTTAQERQNAGFEVQGQGPDDTEFRKLAFVAGYGTTDAPHTYSHELPNLPPGQWHLRLRQLDADDQGHYSTIRSVVLGSRAATATVLPNPAAGRAELQIEAPAATQAYWTLHNTRGQTVLTLPAVALAAGFNQLPLNLQKLPAGLYFWRAVLGTGESMTGKLRLAQ